VILNRPLVEIIASGLVLLIAMTVHEFAHNYIAYRMGDTTPRELGKLTLNPMAHIYWPGWLMWTFFGFGILGQALINPRRMRDPRIGELLAVAAGPFSNLLLAIFFAIPFKLNLLQPEFFFGAGRQALLPSIDQLFTVGVLLNISLFLFNLLPLFPFDGWTVMLRLVPPEVAYQLEPHRQTSMLIFFALFALAALNVIDVFGIVLGPPTSYLARLLLF
jgi:Zn-dependent protease